jgi:hypothetical protein
VQKPAAAEGEELSAGRQDLMSSTRRGLRWTRHAVLDPRAELLQDTHEQNSSLRRRVCVYPVDVAVGDLLGEVPSRWHKGTQFAVRSSTSMDSQEVVEPRLCVAGLRCFLPLRDKEWISEQFADIDQDLSATSPDVLKVVQV